MKYSINDVKNPIDAIGATICLLDGTKGAITGVLSSPGAYPSVYEIELVDGSKAALPPNQFYIDIAIEAGRRYMIMSGEIVTIHAWKFCPDRFLFKYNEHWGETNPCTESIQPNGFAYHYDCGCNILKLIE